MVDCPIPHGIEGLDDSTDFNPSMKSPLAVFGSFWTIGLKGNSDPDGGVVSGLRSY